jgi:hypothetical protein
MLMLALDPVLIWVAGGSGSALRLVAAENVQFVTTQQHSLLLGDCEFRWRVQSQTPLGEAFVETSKEIIKVSTVASGCYTGPCGNRFADT